MRRLWQRLLLFEKFEIQTSHSKEEVLDRVASLLVAHSRDYYGRFTEDGFFVAERSRKYFAFGRVSNSMAPIARARVEERDGKTVISVLMRMKLPVLVVLAPVYVLLCLAIIPLPFLFLILHFAFFRPASRLQNLLREWL